MAGIFDLGNSSSPAFQNAYNKVQGVSQNTPNVAPSAARTPANAGIPNASFNANVSARGALNTRTPWFMTCRSWLGLGGTVQSARAMPKKFLVWACNPSEVSWVLNQRGVLAKNKTGTVLHVWRDNIRKTFYDEPTLNLSLQSGNILPVYVDSNGKTFTTANISDGLDNFYQFLQLFDETKIAADGVGNFVTIQYGSGIFPRMTMIGMFVPDSLRFTDSSGSPNQVGSWTVSFQVYSTVPAFSDYSQLVNIWNSSGFKAQQAYAGYGYAPPSPEVQMAQVSKATGAL